MKSRNRLKYTFALILLCAITTLSFAQNTIQGKVYYNDDNSIVTKGIVKAYDMSGVYVATSSIQSSGTYSIGNLGGTEYDIIAFPNMGEEDDSFIPTGYPNVIDPNATTPILAQGIVINKDIYVTRTTVIVGNRFSSYINGNVSENNRPISDAIVLVKSQENIVACAVTDASGKYIINNVPIGDYILVIHRLGDESASRSVSLGLEGLEKINVNIEPLKNSSKDKSNPVAFKLNQNYPNPFNPSTLISYTISKDSYVGIKVYNSLGELVQVLSNANQKAGAYTVNFDGTGLSSGIYFYTLEAVSENSSFTDTKRMVLVK
jgi:hypothetical protein